MIRQAIIERTIKTINQLPREEVEEISTFVDFMLKKYEEEILTKGIQELVSDSPTFRFLDEDEDIYTASDLKERYHD